HIRIVLARLTRAKSTAARNAKRCTKHLILTVNADMLAARDAPFRPEAEGEAVLCDLGQRKSSPPRPPQHGLVRTDPLIGPKENCYWHANDSGRQQHKSKELQKGSEDFEQVSHGVSLLPLRTAMPNLAFRCARYKPVLTVFFAQRIRSWLQDGGERNSR